MYYSLRITNPANELIVASIIKFCEKIECDKYLFVHETGKQNEKPHYQGALSTNKQLQAVRKAFKAIFPNYKGNKAYSLKSRYTPAYSKSSIPCDENIFAYCTKTLPTFSLFDISDSIVVTNLSVSQFEGYYLTNKTNIENYKLLSKNASIAAKKKKETLFSDALKYLESGFIGFPSHLSSEQIVDCLIQFYCVSDKYDYNSHTFKWLYLNILKKHYLHLYKDYIINDTKKLYNFVNY
jgi:hypothetical protein